MDWFVFSVVDRELIVGLEMALYTTVETRFWPRCREGDRSQARFSTLEFR